MQKNLKEENTDGNIPKKKDAKKLQHDEESKTQNEKKRMEMHSIKMISEEGNDDKKKRPNIFQKIM